MQVKTKVTCYYKDRLRKAGSVFDFDENDMDKGKMPKWADAVGNTREESIYKLPEPTTLHEIAKAIPKVSTVSTPKIQLKQQG